MEVKKKKLNYIETCNITNQEREVIEKYCGGIKDNIDKVLTIILSK